MKVGDDTLHFIQYYWDIFVEFVRNVDAYNGDSFHISMYLPNIVPMELKDKYNSRCAIIVNGYVVEAFENRNIVPCEIVNLICNFFAIIP